MELLWKIIGAAGLVLITTGVLTRNKRREDALYITGGIALITYSVAIGDLIFILLEIMFTATALYDSTRRRKT